METIYRDYSPKGVNFYYIYKALAHPELNGYVKPIALEERLMHVKEAERTLGSDIPWLSDTMDNEFKHAMGNAPNSEFLIDASGKIARMRLWSRPDELRRDLETLVGAVEKPTRIADLDMKTESPPRVAASGVVPRIAALGRMFPLKIEPKIDQSKHPFYVKLRAEAVPSVLESGRGKIYLGFHLDPIYGVHWNNLVDPLRFHIASPDAISVSPISGEAPRVKEASDIDPREFLIDVSGDGTAGPLNLSVSYYGCNDTEGWCKAITQNYDLHLARDPDGGRARRGSARGRRGGMRERELPPEILKIFDLDGNGELDAEERGLLREERRRRMEEEGGFGGRRLRATQQRSLDAERSR